MEEQIRNYQKVLKSNPTDVPAFTALEEIFKGKDRWKDLIGLYEDRIANVQDVEHLLGLFGKCAAVFHHKLADRNRAEQCFLQVVKLQPGNRTALEGLEEIYTEQKSWAQLASVLDRLAGQTDDTAARASLFFRLGELYRDKLKQRDRALVAFGHALAANPQRVDVLDALQAAYLELGYFKRVFELIGREGDLAQANPEAVGQKYLQLGRQLLQEPMFEPTCRESLQKAEGLLADKAPARQALVELDQAQSDWETRIKRLRVEAVEAPDKSRAVNLYRQIAEIYFLQGDHDKQVEENLDKCGLLQPANPRVLAFLESYYLKKRRTKELIERLGEVVAKVKDRRNAVLILERIAMLSAVYLQDKKAAIAAYKRMLELEPGHSSASASLVEYYQEEGRWAEVVELLKGQADRLADPITKTDILFQIARITSDHLKDPEAARFLYEEILRLDRDNLQAALALERTYEKANDHNGLVRCLEIQLLHGRDAADRLKLLERLAALHQDKRNDSLEALRAHLRALAVDPTKKKSLKAVMELGSATGRYQELAAALRTAVESGKLSGKRLHEVLSSLADIHEQRLNNPSEAIRVWQEILEDDPKNMPALDALERLQEASGGSVELVSIYRHQLELVRSGQKKKELLFKLATIYRERMADFAKAIEAFRQVIEIDDQDPQAWSALAELHEREGQWQLAAEALTRSIEGQPDPAARLRLQFRLAGIYEQRLNDTEQALQLCNEILSADGVDGDLAALTVTILERLQGRGVSPLRIAEILQPYYALAGDWRRHIDMLELRLEGCSTAEERVHLLERIAQVYEEELDQKELAFVAFGRAFSVAPQEVNLLQTLLRLADETGRIEDLAGYLEEALKHIQDSGGIAGLSASLGALYRDKLNRPQNAIASFRRVLDHSPDDLEALEALSGLFRSTGRWDELVEVQRRLIALAPEDQARRDQMLELGNVLEVELHDRPSALAVYREVDALVGDDLDVLRRMENLLEKEALWPDLAAVLERLIGLVDGNAANELNLKLGRVRAERMEDREHAVEHYRQVLAGHPDDNRAIEGLESLLERPDSAPAAAELLQPIYEKREDHQGLVRVLEVRAEASDQIPVKVETLLRVSQIYDRRLSQMDRAFASLRRAFRADASRQDVLQAMERLAEKSGAYEGLTAALEEALGSSSVVEQQVFLLQTLAGLYRDKLRRPDLATTSLRRLLEVEPQHASALASLEALYREAKSFQDLAWVLSRQSEAASDPETKRDLLVQAAQISEEQLGDLERAVEAYSQVFASDPTDLHAAKQLDRLFQATGRWEDEATLLPKLASLSKNILGVIDYNSRLADIYARRLDDPRRAVQIYQQILQSKPNQPETIAALETLLADERCRQAAAEVLEGVYRSTTEWRKLAAILEMRLAAVADPAERMKYYLQLKEVFEIRMEERAMAFQVAARAFREQPGDEGISSDLLRLAGEGKFFEELVGVYQDVAERVVGTELSTTLRKKVAVLSEQHLGQRAEALAEWEQLLEADESDEEVLAALERLYREDGNFSALVRVYLKQVELTDETERKKDLMFQAAASLAEGVEDLDGAIAIYQRILDLDPKDRRALRLLDQLLVVADRFSELASVIEREIALAPEIGAEEGAEVLRIGLYLRLAQLHLDHLEAPGASLTALENVLAIEPAEVRAVEQLERMLTMDSARQQAAELLEPVYRRIGEMRKLVAIMEVRLAARKDPAERLILFRELMKIYEVDLTQKPLAFMVACRAFRENVEDDGIRLELERLATDSGSYEELAGVYQEVLPLAEGTASHPVIGRRLAQIKEAYLEEKDEAVSHWHQVLASDPDDAEALRALERLYRERGAYPELVGVLRHMASIEGDRDRRKDLLHDVATLMEERLGRNDGAIDAYREILAEDPNDLAVLKLLDRLLNKDERWEELKEILLAQIDKAATSELLALKLRLGELLRSRLRTPEDAVGVLAEVLEQSPGQAEAIAALVAMFDAGEAKLEVARVLVGVLEPVEDWRHLIASLEVIHNSSEELEERKAALLKIAQTYESRMGQKELAFNTLGRAFQEDPGDEGLRTELERLAAETTEFELLAAIYQRRLEGLEERSTQLLIHKRLAELFAQQLADPVRGVEHLKASVALNPKDLPSLLALEAAHRQSQDHEALAEVLRKRLKLTKDPQVASAILYEIASIHETFLGDVGGAIQAYRDVIERQPDDLSALRMLDNLCTQQGRLRELAEVLVAEIKLLDETDQNQEALDLRFRLGQLYEQEFGDDSRAARLYRDILQADPAHIATIQHLESQLSEGRSFEGATALLETAYEHTGDWKKYLEILEGQVRQSRVMARRLELLEAIAKVQEEKMGLSFMAFNTWIRMFHEDLSNAMVRAQLERLAIQDDNLEALAAVYEEELDNIEEPEVGAAVALKVARIQLENLEDEDEALRFFRTCLRFDPRSLEALQALDALYERREQWDDLVGVLSKEVDLLKEPAELVDVLYRLGTILLEKLEQSSKSVGYFRRALDLDPQHLDSLRSLERAFAEQGDHESLYEALKGHLALISESDDRIELVARIADLAANQLKRPDEAIELWRDLLVNQPADDDAFEALDRLYEQTSRWAELAQLLESRMSLTADPEKIASLSSRLGWVKGEKLGELEEAMKNWQEVLRLDPKNESALQALRGIYTAGGQWQELLAVLRKLVPLQSEMLKVKVLRFELAEILGEKLKRRDEAIEAAKRALDIEPHSAEDLERLARIFQTNEAWQDAVSVLEHGVELREATADKVDLLLEVAGIWKDKIGRPLGATPAYEKVLELDAFHEEAYRTSQEIYRQHKEWRRLTGVLEGRLTHIRERKDRLVLIKEIAEIYEQHLGQKELAFARYCAAFREDFSDDSVLVKLEQLASETEDYETLLEVLEDATGEVTTGHRAVGLLQKVADIYRHRMGDAAQAESFLTRAVQLDKREVSSLVALADLYEAQERWDDLIRILETQYERSDELDQRKEIRARIAYLQEEQLDRIDSAIESYRRILELDGRDTRAIQSLIRLYQQEGRWHELISMLRRAADQSEDREVALNYLFNIATIWETELDSDEDAIDAFRAVVEFEASHLPSLKALERIYTRLDSWNELLGVFEKQVELVADPEEKIKIFNKMGSIWEERFSQAENAASCHENILEIDSSHLPSIKALERLVRRMGDFSRLIDLYQRHIELIEDRNEIVNIHLAIGEVWYHELNRVDKAEDTFNRALEIDDRSREAIHALGQLYEKSGNWFNAIEMLQREAELFGATPEAVDLYYRMGKINEDMLLDSSAAREAYQRGLSIDPSYLPAIKALKLIYYLDKEHDLYLEMMAQEAEYTEDAEEKTRLFHEIGKFLQEQRDDSVEAARYYEEALNLTPDYLPAAKPLADIYFRSEQWDRAEQMMEVVVAGLDRNTESKELCRQYYRLGYITEKLSKEERALEHYRMSYELDATYLPALEGLGNALIKTEQWEEAYRIYQTILIHHRDSLSDAEVAELYWQIGDVNFQMGEVDRAIDSFTKALDIDDSHLSSMQYLLRIHEEQQNWEEAYEFGMQMVEYLDEDELFEHRLRMADMCRKELQDPFRAVDSLQGALRIRPDSLDVLTRLRDVYRETRQHQKAIETLDAMIEVEARPRHLVELHVEAAGLLHKELRDDVRAVEHYNTALDIDPSFIQAFQSASEILSTRKDWLALKENYIKMIKRLPVSARKTKLALWKDLGELCRVVLRSLNESIDAYRMITTLDPDDVDSLAILGDLLAAKQGAADDAIAVHHKVLSMAADRVKSYRALWKLYNQQKKYDQVFVLTSILWYLKKADEEEQKIVAYFSKRLPKDEARPVTDRIWETSLAHPMVKVPFTRIFGLMYRMAAPMFIVDHKDVGLRKKEHQIDLARDRSLFAHNFRIAAKALGGPNLELFALKEQQAPAPPGLALALTQPTAVIAYRDMFQLDKKKHLLFHIGRQLAMTRPEFLLACALPITELNNLLQAACQLFKQSHQGEGDPRGIERARNGLKRTLNEQGMGMLKRAVAEYLDQARSFNLKRWVEGVEHSINRAGLVVCADTTVALSILRRETAGLTPMRPVTRVTELLKFASSQEFFQLREALKLVVKT
jgi:tetratricopeptide (TPR) repeat protein